MMMRLTGKDTDDGNEDDQSWPGCLSTLSPSCLSPYLPQSHLLLFLSSSLFLHCILYCPLNLCIPPSLSLFLFLSRTAGHVFSPMGQGWNNVCSDAGQDKRKKQKKMTSKAAEADQLESLSCHLATLALVMTSYSQLHSVFQFMRKTLIWKKNTS